RNHQRPIRHRLLHLDLVHPDPVPTNHHRHAHHRRSRHAVYLAGTPGLCAAVALADQGSPLMNNPLIKDNRLAVLDYQRLKGKDGRPGGERGNIRVQDLDIEFASATGHHTAVSKASLTIRSGEFVCLLGPSGCGKSTLLNAIAGFVQPTRGELTIDRQAVTEPGPDRGMVFQQHSLFPWKTVRDNVAFGPLMSGMSPSEASSVARTFLSLVGLAAFESAYPTTLSGGMQQRVGIARALANYPSV